MNFPDLVAKELADARRLHPKPFNSLHEGYAILFEEVLEFWDEVRVKGPNRNRRRILKELAQVSAMAQRAAEDLGLCVGAAGE
jgi:NTP pyrophosphatase (non-canonical NTP hydrolase)